MSFTPDYSLENSTIVFPVDGESWKQPNGDTVPVSLDEYSSFSFKNGTEEFLYRYDPVDETWTAQSKGWTGHVPMPWDKYPASFHWINGSTPQMAFADYYFLLDGTEVFYDPWNNGDPDWPAGQELILCVDDTDVWGAMADFDEDFAMGYMTNITHVTEAAGLFRRSQLFTGTGMEYLDTKNIEVFEVMFDECVAFNGDPSGWNTRKAQEMEYMFTDCSAFSQDLSQWCVPLIKSEPLGFDDDAPLFTADKHPVWGTCPRGEDKLPYRPPFKNSGKTEAEKQEMAEKKAAFMAGHRNSRWDKPSHK